MSTIATRHRDVKPEKHKYQVGDLVQIITEPDLIYMLIPRDYRNTTQSLPMKVGDLDLAGVVVHTANKVDSDGDKLPELGYVHPGFRVSACKPYVGSVRLISR